MGADKVAVVIGSGCNGKSFTVNGSSVSGTTGSAMTDPGTGYTVCKADFSTLNQTGTFSLTVSGFGTSDTFSVVSSNLYPNLYANAVYYFTYHRHGASVVNIWLPGSAGGTVTRNWSLRPTTVLSAYNGWTSGTFNIDGGWVDAGDFGLYPENAAQSLWMMMNALEYLNPSVALPEVPEGTLLEKSSSARSSCPACSPRLLACLRPTNVTTTAGARSRGDSPPGTRGLPIRAVSVTAWGPHQAQPMRSRAIDRSHRAPPRRGRQFDEGQFVLGDGSKCLGARRSQPKQALQHLGVTWSRHRWRRLSRWHAG